MSDFFCSTMYYNDMKDQDTVEKITVEKREGIRGEATVPGDKSISHRAVMIGSLAEGTSSVKGYSKGADTKRTIQAFQTMGVHAEVSAGGRLIIDGKGLHGLKEPDNIIDAGNSGTSMRLLSGLLSAQEFFSVITGDDSLRRRPMKRVVDPLRSMGAEIWGRDEGAYAPLAIRGTKLRAIEYTSPIASAQLKSAILFAGLYADGSTRVTEPHISRDHTERMLSFFGADLTREGTSVSLSDGVRLTAKDLDIPGDISSAAFLMVAALIIPDSELLLKHVGVNPTRTGILDILREMGAHIEIQNRYEGWGEPTADIYMRTSSLKGITIEKEMVPRAIDEFPILCIAASVAEGETVIKDAGELRKKETDRIKAMATELPRFGIKVDEADDGMTIFGRDDLKGCECESYKDHRVAMSLVIAGLRASGRTVVHDTTCIGTSFPEFKETLDSLIQSK